MASELEGLFVTKDVPCGRGSAEFPLDEPSPAVRPKPNAEPQQILVDVRGLVVERDKFRRQFDGAVKQIDHMIVERDRLEAVILKAPHASYCASWADRACDCWKSDVRLGGTGASRG